MWSACCNWLCLDSATRDDTSTQPQAYTNSGYTSHPSPLAPDHTCRACGLLFDLQNRKYVCMDCKKSFCSRCSLQLELRPRLCLICQLFYGALQNRVALMKFKVKDLRDYLHLHGIPTQMCREKEELVELVLVQQTPSSTNSIEPTMLLTTAQPSTAASMPPEPPPPPADSSDLELLTQEDNQSPSEPVTSSPEGIPDSQSNIDVRGAHESQSSDPEETIVLGRRASLSDLSQVEDIEALSVRQLKEILARNFVDYKGCCEKWELMERVTRLFKEQKDLQNLGERQLKLTSMLAESSSAVSREENLCKICMDLPIDCVLLECGHMITCTKCGKRMNECPICRQYVVRAIHVFRS
ncbi:hypothetical protein GN956_G8083 [Arapaima gigas]